MSALLRLQLKLSGTVEQRDDRGFEPMCDVLKRMANERETPRVLKRAIRQAVATATEERS